MKSINFITDEDHNEQYLEFIRNEKRRSNVMTMARVQPFCRANNINMGCFDGTRVFPRSVTDRNNALFLHSNHFCLIWKSEGVSFNQAIKELKDNFEIVDLFSKCITEEIVKDHFKYEFTPTKIESHLTNFFVYDLETRKTDKARPYNMTFYRLSNLAGRYNCDLTPYEIEKCKNETLVFDGDNCVNNALVFLLKTKGEERKVIIKLLNIIDNFMLIMDQDSILGYY